MTIADANALEQFIKDHDTRMKASAVDCGAESYVALVQHRDGSELEPVRSMEDYQKRYVESSSAGPTIRESWEKWRPSP